MNAHQLELQVLVIGLDPHPMSGRSDPAPVAQSIQTGMDELVEHGIGTQSCLFGLDGRDNPEELITTALRGQPWRCVIIGIGLRKADDELVPFERIVNLVRHHAPHAAIAFNATIPEFYTAAARWIDVADKPIA
ncbi:hypothetical protein ABIB25_000045 [Nakamurella sp. UYEF19]|uniref:hypothetical protein n=1 Tax=Nakamurella sp. UYEF19 TaxID=1756392 RepID=UPI0033917A5F